MADDPAIFQLGVGASVKCAGSNSQTLHRLKFVQTTSVSSYVPREKFQTSRRPSATRPSSTESSTTLAQWTACPSPTTLHAVTFLTTSSSSLALLSPSSEATRSWLPSAVQKVCRALLSFANLFHQGTIAADSLAICDGTQFNFPVGHPIRCVDI